MKIIFICLLVSFTSYIGTKAQQLTFLKEVIIPAPAAVSIDRYSNILSADKKGNVFKYDSTGKLLQTFSSPTIVSVSSIEAWSSLQVFVFYRDSQQYSLLNRFMTPVSYAASVNAQIIGFARAATMGSQESLWVFDDTDFSIKKYSHTSNILTLHTPLSLILNDAEYQINFMREYQNTLFINDANSGILVFDNLGNYKKKLPFPGLTYFNFYENQLYFLKDNAIHFFDLYTLTEKKLSLPAGVTYTYALLSGTKVFLFTNRAILIYQLL